MVNYINGYSIASDSDHESLLLHFWQRFPDVDPDGTMGEQTKTDLLGSFIMDRDIATSFAEAVLDLMNENEPEEKSSEE